MDLYAVYFLGALFIIFLVGKALYKKIQKTSNGQIVSGAVAPNTTTPVTPATPAVPATPPTLKEKSKKLFASKEFRIGLGVGVGILILVGVVWFLTSDKVGVKTLAPYVFVPLFGLFAYYNSDGKRNRNLTYSMWVVVIAVMAISLFLHPQMFKDMFAPFSAAGTIHHIFRDGSWGLPVLAFVGAAYLMLDGKTGEGITVGFIALIFFILWLPSSPAGF